jgi:hypothetical protein
MHLDIQGRAASDKVGYFFAALFFRRSTHRFLISCDNRLPLSAFKWPRFLLRPAQRRPTLLAASLLEGLPIPLQQHPFSSAFGCITPKDMLAGHRKETQADRDRKIGGRERTAEESPPACRVTDETDYFRFADNTGVSITSSITLVAVRM